MSICFLNQLPLVKLARDGILGHQFNKRLGSFALCYSENENFCLLNISSIFHLNRGGAPCELWISLWVKKIQMALMGLWGAQGKMIYGEWNEVGNLMTLALAVLAFNSIWVIYCDVLLNRAQEKCFVCRWNWQQPPSAEAFIISTSSSYLLGFLLGHFS